jgi:PTS system mannose-specific IIA component
VKYGGKKMVGILVITHGRLARALISSVEFLVGKLQKIRGVYIWPKDTDEQVKKRIQKKMLELDEGDGILVLTDILGGTPTSLGLSFLEKYNVEVVTGVNIPMLITVSSYRRGRSLEEISQLVKKSGQRSIVLAKGMFGYRRRIGVTDR